MGSIEDGYEIHPCKSLGIGQDGREVMQECGDQDPDIACFGIYKRAGGHLEWVSDHKTKLLAVAALAKLVERSKQSVGHVGWVGDYEYFRNPAGDLYRAHLTDVLDPATGSRQGRFECSAATADKLIGMLGLAKDPEIAARSRAYQQRKTARILRLSDRANAAGKAGAAEVQNGVKMLSSIPLGQPVHIGHYSEKGDRSFRRRASAKVEKGISLLEKAQDLQALASAAADNNAISSDDPLALKKITERISALEAKREWMKLVNQHFTKGTLDQIGFTAEQITAIEERMKVCRTDKPYMPYTITNLGANIRRLEDRARTLMGRATRDPVEETYGGIEVVENVDLNRVQIRFPEKPEEAVRDHLSKRGFRFSYAETAWQAFRSPWALHEARECVKKFFPDAHQVSQPLLTPAETRPRLVGIDELIAFTVKLDRKEASAAQMQEMWTRLGASGPTITKEYAALEQHARDRKTAAGLPPGGNDHFDMIQLWFAGHLIVVGEYAIEPEFKQQLDAWAKAHVQKIALTLDVTPPAEASGAAVSNNL